MRVHLNGRLVDEREALVSAFDRGFLLGDGVFESMRSVAGRIFRIGRHLERLRRSASLIGLDLPQDGAAIPRAVDETLRANGLREARARVTITRGPGRPGDYLYAPGPPTIVIVTLPFREIDPAVREAGIDVSIPRRRQVPPDVLDPAIKSTSRLSSVLARREASACGSFEAILLDAQGNLTEGTVSNLFIVSRGRLLTPALPDGCLPGITRAAVIDLAREDAIEVREECLPAAALDSADELFLTNTSWEILPVARVDGRPIASGRPGPVARDLLVRYRGLVRRECERG